MADVRISSLCSSLDLRGRACRQTGEACPFLDTRNFGDCPRCAFVASVSIQPMEFHVLLDSHRRPTEGLVPIRTCRATTWRHGAGAYVNAVHTDGPDSAILEIDRAAEDEVTLVCRPARVELIWRNGQFRAVS